MHFAEKRRMIAARGDLEFAAREFARRAAALPQDAGVLSAGGRAQKQANLVLCETKGHSTTVSRLDAVAPYGIDDE